MTQTERTIVQQALEKFAEQRINFCTKGVRELCDLISFDPKKYSAIAENKKTPLEKLTPYQ